MTRGYRKTVRYDAVLDLAERWPGWSLHQRDLAGVPAVICEDQQILLIDPAEWPEGWEFAVAHCVARLDLGMEAEGPADWLAEVRLDVPRS